jgi:tetratricopeptide (TPR) repeat protein
MRKAEVAPDGVREMLERAATQLDGGHVRSASDILERIGGPGYRAPKRLPLDVRALFYEVAGDTCLRRSDEMREDDRDNDAIKDARRAIDAFRNLLGLERQLGESDEALANSYVRLGEAYARAGETRKTTAAFGTARRLVSRADAESRASVLTSFALGLIALERIDEAVLLFREAAPLWDEHGDAAGSALGWRLLGTWLRQAARARPGHYPDANDEVLRVLRRGLAFAKKARAREEISLLNAEIAEATTDAGYDDVAARMDDRMATISKLRKAGRLREALASADGLINELGKKRNAWTALGAMKEVHLQRLGLARAELLEALRDGGAIVAFVDVLCEASIGLSAVARDRATGRAIRLIRNLVRTGARARATKLVVRLWSFGYEAKLPRDLLALVPKERLAAAQE